MSSKVIVSVNGETLENFESGTIQLTMAEATNSFDLDAVVQPVPGARIVRRDDLVTVAIDGGNGPEDVITGYVDACNDRDTPTELYMKFAGRSLAQDIVDSSAVTPDQNGTAVPMSWKGATIDKIVSDLAAPHGVGVFIDSDPGKPFPQFAVQKGERVIDAIQRAALKRGLHCYSVGGDLVLARTGATRCKTVLERGVNVEEWEYSDSGYNRFSEYRLRAQTRPTDDSWGKASSQMTFDVIDLGVGRYRPMLIQSDAHDGLDLKGRAEFERNLRAGQGETLTAMVIGWLAEADGFCWRPNSLVHCKNPVIGIDATFLIVTARYRFGPNEPETVVLEMALPAAYDSAQVYAENARGEKLSKKAVKRGSGG